MLIKEKILRYPAVALTLLMLPWPDISFAANYQWIQSDWSGGETTSPVSHDPAQNGQTLWDRYLSRDANVDTTSTPGQISLSPFPTSVTRTSDADFNSGILTNLEIVGTGASAYMKIRDYVLDVGNGADGDLVVDGTIASNSTDGLMHNASNPFIIDGTKKYANVTVQNGGVISSASPSLLSLPANVTVTSLSGRDGPDGTFYYVVTAVDRFGFETPRSPSADGPSNAITVSGNNAPQISWSPVAGASGYRVYRRAYYVSGYSSPALICSTTTATTCVDTLATPQPGAPHLNVTPAFSTPTISCTGGTLANGTYYYAATAIDFGGVETTVGTQLRRTISCGTGTASITLKWNTVIGASRYRVYRTRLSGIYNNPAMVCEATSTTCADTSQTLLPGAPPRSYDFAIANGGPYLRVSGTLFVDSTSTISTIGKGFPGGPEDQVAYGFGLPGYGSGAAGNRGAGGGYGTAGGNNSNTNFPGNIGYTYGDDLLTGKYPGSGGASGTSSAITGYWGGRGGNGGGSIWISGNTVRIDGSILADGDAGAPGVSSNSSTRSSGGGGGGSGGSVLIEGNSVTINGIISAAGGAGGISGTPVRNYAYGGSGGSGRIRISSGALTLNGTINPAPMIGHKGSYESPPSDLGVGGVGFLTIDWSSIVPSGSNLKFQIATNKDNQTWNFVGPGGSSSTYYPADEPACGPQTCPIYSGHDSDRYMKFRVLFDSTSIRPENSPILDSVTINYQFTSPLQSLTSSPYDSTDSANTVRRWFWLEDLSQSGTDVVLQMRTSANGTSWGPWYGPHSTTFSSSSGVTTITVTDVTGFSMGSRVTLTNISDPAQTEVKKIISIDAVNRRITLDSATSYAYAAGSIFMDTYTDPGGTEEINPVHRDGSSDRWVQYRVLLSTENGLNTPFFLENRIGYLPASGIYRPDGVVDGNGDNLYGAFGSGGGGASTKPVDPGFILQQPLTYDVRVQNDGTPQSVNDTYTITWNSPSDVSGNWSVLLNDGAGDLTSPAYVTLNAGAEKTYTMKVTPSAYAPADSVQDIILNLRSENEYARVDSIRATARVNRIFQADGLIDNIGDNLYDPNRTGGGGTSSRDAGPGDIVGFSVMLQNEGNIADTYTFSLLNPPPVGWIVYINDGSSDHDITNPSAGWTTTSIPPPPYSGSTVTYTLKVIPKGAPLTSDIILNIYSNGGTRYMDSLTARLNLKGVYKVDGIIYNYSALGAGCEVTPGTILEIIGDNVGNDNGVCEQGEACYSNSSGDNIYGALSSGKGGCTALDIGPTVTREVTVGIQNEGNVPDSYSLRFTTPSDWQIVIPEGLSGNCAIGCTTSTYNPGEVPFFTFKITPPSTFTSGSRTIIFDINSLGGDSTKVDSVKAIINSGDTTPPAAAVLSLGSVTATSVKVSWSAPGDNGGNGTAKSYDLRYSTSVITDANFAQAKRVSGCKSGETILRQPKSGGSSESCTVTQLFADTDYYFALKTTDDAGRVSAISTCSSPPSCMVHTGSSTDDFTAPGAITDLNAAYTRVIYPMSNTAFAATTHAVSLQWTAKADDGNTSSSGPATAYDLRYSTRKIVDDSATPGAGEIRFSEAKSVAVLLRFDTQGIVPVCLDGITDLAQLDEAFISNQGELLPPRSSGGAECYTVIVENRINTGGNIIDDRTQNTRFYFAIKGLDERQNKSLLSNVAGGLTALIPYAYNMVSIPYVPPSTSCSNPTNVLSNHPKCVFGDDVGAQLYAYWWDSRGPNFDSGCYDGVPEPYSSDPSRYACLSLNSIKEGLGYFLWVPAGSVILDVPSGSTQAPAQSCVDDLGGTFQCYVFPLQEGWSMAAPPFDKEINFTSRDINGNGSIESAERGLYVRRTSGNRVDIATFQDAVTAKNWIDGSIFTYNGVNYTYEVCDQDRTGEPQGTRCSLVMQPWKAYWIRMHVLGGATFELLIPN